MCLKENEIFFMYVSVCLCNAWANGFSITNFIRLVTKKSENLKTVGFKVIITEEKKKI